MTALKRRLAALEGGPAEMLPMCCVIAADGEDEDAAIARHVANGECKPNDGHMVWRIVDPQKRRADV